MPNREAIESHLAHELGWPQPTALAVEDLDGLTTDLVVNADGHLELQIGRREVLQAIYLRTIGQKGDWIFDLEFGLPWLDHPRMSRSWLPILGMKPPDFDYLKAAVLAEWGRERRFRFAHRLDVGWNNESRRSVEIRAGIVASLRERGQGESIGLLRVRMPLGG
jgi:hypothetical protein